MAFKTIRTLTRPNKYVPFFLIGEEIKTYIDETYNQTGKRISVNTVLSEDELQQITTSVWTTIEECREFLKDPTIVNHGKLLDEYNTAFGIVGATVVDPEAE
jgi:hypothetical protein